MYRGGGVVVSSCTLQSVEPGSIAYQPTNSIVHISPFAFEVFSSTQWGLLKNLLLPLKTIVPKVWLAGLREN